MAVVETHTNLWSVLAGRPPAPPVQPTDADVWQLVVQRLNPAKARPMLRDGVEEARLTSLRGQPYVMLRSPDREGCYLRLTPDEVELAHRMDGTRTVASLVGELARISGRLAPEQVTRLVADLAANRMLDELPRDAFHPLERLRRRPFVTRLGHGMLAAARGQRMVLGDVDGLVTFLHRFGGRLLFTPPAAVLMSLVAIAGFGVFVLTWAGGAQSAFISHGSYAVGGLVLLAINALCLVAHELGHALGAKHAGRKVPAAGVLLYFGIPSAFVDTTDVWMAGRRARLITTASGPAASLVLAGASQLVGLMWPELAPVAFKLSFAWYLNSLFNLNPLLALDGYYLLMDWLEIPNLRARGIAFIVTAARRGRRAVQSLDREGRLVAAYGIAALVWMAISFDLGIRMYKDRVSGLIAGLWRSGLPARILFLLFVAGLLSPLVHAMAMWLGRRLTRARERRLERRREADAPRRLDALRLSPLVILAAEQLDVLAREARWVHPRRGTEIVAAGQAVPGVFAVVDGALEGRQPGDPPGTVRDRATAGQLVGTTATLEGTVSQLSWLTVGTRLLLLPRRAFVAAVGPNAEALRPPTDNEDTMPAATERRHSGMWWLPAAAELGVIPLGLTGGRRAQRAPDTGVHGSDGYPPLDGPAGPPPPGGDEVDRRLGRWFRRLLLLLLFLLVLATVAVFPPGRVWAEVPTDRATLVVESGVIDAFVDGRHHTLHAHNRIAIGAHDVVTVQPQSEGDVIFRGGADTILCAGTEIEVVQLASSGSKPIAPAAALTLRRGTLLAATESQTFAFSALSLQVGIDTHVVANEGEAQFAVTFPDLVRVANGSVTLDDDLLPVGSDAQTCGSEGSTHAQKATTPTTEVVPTSTTAIPDDRDDDADDSRSRPLVVNSDHEPEEEAFALDDDRRSDEPQTDADRHDAISAHDGAAVGRDDCHHRHHAATGGHRTTRYHRARGHDPDLVDAPYPTAAPDDPDHGVRARAGVHLRAPTERDPHAVLVLREGGPWDVPLLRPGRLRGSRPFRPLCARRAPQPRACAHGSPRRRRRDAMRNLPAPTTAGAAP